MESLALLPKQVDDEGYVVKDNVALSSLSWMEDGIVTQAAVRGSQDAMRAIATLRF